MLIKYELIVKNNMKSKEILIQVVVSSGYLFKMP